MTIFFQNEIEYHKNVKSTDNKQKEKIILKML